jgi:hypothetical protein
VAELEGNQTARLIWAFGKMGIRDERVIEVLGPERTPTLPGGLLLL